MRSSNELKTHWQTIPCHAAGKRNDRTTGQRQHEGQKHPIDVSGELLTCDLSGKALLHWKRRHRDRRTNEKVVLLEELRNVVIDAVARAHRRHDVCGCEL